MSSLSDFLLGPNNPQQVTSSATSSQTLPAWLTDYSKNLIGSANSLVPSTVSSLGNASSPLSTAQPYLGQASSLVSGATNPATQGLAASQPYLGSATSTLGSALNGPNGVSLAQPSISNASSMIGNAVNPANSGLSAASPYLSQADQTFNNPHTVQSYMSPYLSAVTGYNTQLANQNLFQNVIPQVEDQFIANGTFGSSPMGTALGKQIDQTQQNLQAQNLAAANQGYTEAGSLFNSDAARQAQLAGTAGSLGTAQQGAELQGASTLGSLGTALGSLGNASQSNALTGAGLYGSLGSAAGSLANAGAGLGLSGASTLGSLGSAAGQLGGTGNSELLSQLGLLTSMTGVPGGSTTTQNQSYPNPYSLAQTAGAGSSSLANLLSTLTASGGGLSSLLSGLNGSGGTTGANNNLNSIINSYPNSPDLGGSLTNVGTPDFSSVTSPDFSAGSSYGFSPNYGGGANDFNDIFGSTYARGGRVRAPDRPFMAADGGAVTLPTIAQDLSLAADPNAIFMPGDLSAAYRPQQFQSQPSSSLPAGGAAPQSSLASVVASLLGGSPQSSSPAYGGSSLGSTLGLVNQGASLYNTGSKLTGGTGLSGTPIGSTLGSVNDLYGIYNAVQHPGLATGIGGASGVADLYSKLSGNSLGSLGGALGAVGEGAGLYNAFAHPSVGNTLSGAYDAYKLYNTASSLMGGLGSGAGSAAGAFGGASAGAGSALGAGTTAADALGGIGGAGTGATAGAGAGAGAGSGALSSIGTAGAYAVPLAYLAAMGQVVNGVVQGNQRGPALTFDDMAGLTQNPYGKLPSGNSIAAMGNLGFGEGNNEAQGSGQFYRINPSGSAKYDWLGQSATDQANSAFRAYQESLKPAGAANPSSAFSFTGGYSTANDPTAALKSANTGFSNVFTSTGGAKAWGMSEADFQKQMIAMMSDANAHGGKGLGVGVG